MSPLVALDRASGREPPLLAALLDQTKPSAEVQDTRGLPLKQMSPRIRPENPMMASQWGAIGLEEMEPSGACVKAAVRGA